MDMRDRLAELIDQKQEYGIATESKPEEWLTCENSDLADHLIANGVQIVRHGKWEYIGTDKHENVFRCSNCALRIGLDYETTYCPHCGAKMDLDYSQ